MKTDDDEGTSTITIEQNSTAGLKK